MSKIECLVGSVISAFIRTEYLLSNIAFDLNITSTRTEFFANSRASKKFNQLAKSFSQNSIKNSEDYIDLINKFDKLREERNMVAHSLILTNIKDENSLKFHNYLKQSGNIIDKTKNYSKQDLQLVEQKIIEIHNALYGVHFDQAKLKVQ